MRENLIVLLNEAPTDYDGNRNVGVIADHLIANGVTVQKQSEWTEFVDDDPYVGELRYPMCKRCNHIALVASRYCPDCGALMRRGGVE